MAARVSPTRPGVRVGFVHEELRRATRSTVLGEGTLACARCDAPVSPGPRALSPAELIGCPFCRHRAPAREFLSLRRPTRPARVLVTVRRPPV